MTARDVANNPTRPVAVQFNVDMQAKAPPTVGVQLLAVEVGVGQTVTVPLAGAFVDPLGGTLTYAITAQNTSVATAVESPASADAIRVVGVAEGMTTVAVVASAAGGSARQAFDVTVLPRPVNQPPEVGRAFDNLDLDVGATARVSLADAFNDPEGDALRYAVTTSRADVATVSPVGSGSEDLHRPGRRRRRLHHHRHRERRHVAPPAGGRPDLRGHGGPRRPAGSGGPAGETAGPRCRGRLLDGPARVVERHRWDSRDADPRRRSPEEEERRVTSRPPPV